MKLLTERTLMSPATPRLIVLVVVLTFLMLTGCAHLFQKMDHPESNDSPTVEQVAEPSSLSLNP